MISRRNFGALCVFFRCRQIILSVGWIVPTCLSAIGGFISLVVNTWSDENSMRRSGYYKTWRGLCIIVITSFSSSAYLVPEQHRHKTPADLCIPELHGSFGALKVFPIKKGLRNFVEHSFSFAKDTEYMLGVCVNNRSEAGDLLISIYDSRHNKVKEILVKAMDMPSTVIYECPSTNVYYLRYTFAGNENYYGSGVLGFRKNDSLDPLGQE